MPSDRTPIVLLLLAVLLAASGLFSTAATAQTTFTVCPSGCDHTSIQSAIDAASTGDTIAIGEGVYLESDINLQGKGVIVTGTVDTDGALLTTVDADGLDTVFRASSGEPAGTTVKDLIVTGGIGYRANSSNNRFGGAFYMYSNSNLRIEGCRIVGNSANTWCGAVYGFQANLEIEDCSILDNTSTNYLIKNYNGSTLVIDCTIASNVVESGTPLLNTDGSGLHEYSGTKFLCNYPNSPEEATSHIQDAGGNCFGLECEGVDADGDYVPDICTNAFSVCQSGCDFTSVNDAIDAAPSTFSIVQLPPGAHCEGAEIDLDGKAIMLRGVTSPAGVPISSLSGIEDHRVIACRSGEPEASMVCDLIIHSGLANDVDGGGGMLISNSSTRVLNCVFQNNTSTTRGGGLAVSDASFSDPDGGSQISDSIFRGNTAAQGGGISTYSQFGGGGPGGAMADLLIIDNTATQAGGGMWTNGTDFLSSLVLIGNEAPVGSGGGIYAAANQPIPGRVYLSDSIVRDNIGGGLAGEPGKFGAFTALLFDSTVCGNDGGNVAGSIDGENYCVSTVCSECASKETVDSDEDGVPNFEDVCPGGDDTLDADQDGIPDACDAEPELCDCELLDSDADGVSDCIDNCPSDPEKIEPGVCGCGFPDTDTDSDGTADCLDGCPDDPDKTEPGNCGCGTAETTVFGDIDCDGDYDADDIRLGMVEYGIVEAGACPADINGDGVVDAQDLTEVLAAWQEPCGE